MRDSFGGAHGKTNFKNIYCGILPICEHVASKYVITRYTFIFSIFPLASNDMLILNVADIMFKMLSYKMQWQMMGEKKG